MKFFSASWLPLSMRKTSADGRLAVRRKQRFVDGFIWADTMLVARECSVRDLSAVGALVELWNREGRSPKLRELPIPDKVVLFVVPDGREIDCKVTWRKDGTLGLKFTGAFRPASRKYGGR